MTDVASGVPAQQSGEVASASTTTSTTADAPSTYERAQEVAERAQEVAGRVGEQVSVAVERAASATGRFVASTVDRFRNNAELVSERGRTTIANEVVEKIAGIAVAGVHDLGGDVARAFAAVRERVGLGEAEDNKARGVSVRLEGTAAAIDLTIVVVYGHVVFTVTEKVRAQVISSVENLLGLEVTEVNINVDDVHVDEAAPAPAVTA
jgi:uncharacterized alkaline shock family protein YloU